MVDMRTTRHHRRHQRQHLTTRVRSTHPTPQAHHPIHQILQPQAVHQRPSHQQTRVGHQRIIIENHPIPINILRYSTHRKCLQTLSQNRVFQRSLSQIRGTSPRQSNPTPPPQPVDSGLGSRSSMPSRLRRTRIAAIGRRQGRIRRSVGAWLVGTTRASPEGGAPSGYPYGFASILFLVREPATRVEIEPEPSAELLIQPDSTFRPVSNRIWRAVGNSAQPIAGIFVIPLVLGLHFPDFEGRCSDDRYGHG